MVYGAKKVTWSIGTCYLTKMNQTCYDFITMRCSSGEGYSEFIFPVPLIYM